MSNAKLKAKELLAMYRCAFYSAMGVKSDDALPTDRQCVEWMQRIIGQAEHRNDPPIVLIAYPPERIPSGMQAVPFVELRRWDVRINLPPWKDLPR